MDSRGVAEVQVPDSVVIAGCSLHCDGVAETFDPVFPVFLDLLSSHPGGYWPDRCNWLECFVKALVFIPSLLVFPLPLAKIDDFLFFLPYDCSVNK